MAKRQEIQEISFVALVVNAFLAVKSHFSALRLLSLFTVEDNSALSVLGIFATGDAGGLQ
jgi:hypothetical protein